MNLRQKKTIFTGHDIEYRNVTQVFDALIAFVHENEVIYNLFDRNIAFFLSTEAKSYINKMKKYLH